MKQKTMRILTTTSIGLISLGAAGFGGYWVYNSYPQRSTPVLHDYDFQAGTTIGGLEIKMAPVDVKNKKYFLSADGKEKFATAVASFLNYGPEFYDVPTIYIDNMNGIGDKENGNYLPSGHSQMKDNRTDMINLNSQNFIKQGLYAVSADEINDPNQNIKIELLMQILFHEYGHFLANKYLQSEPRENNQDKYSVFADTTDGKTKIIDVKWNKVFMDEFEKDLNYNKDTVFRDPLLKGRKRDASYYNGVESIGSIYSASELWQISNHVVKGDKRDDLFSKFNNESGTLYSAGGLRTQIMTSPKLAFNYDSDSTKKSSEKLSYLYNTDEVFTRKYQQILMPYHSAHGEGNNKISINGIVSVGQTNNIISPFQTDTLNYMDRDTEVQGNQYWLSPGYNTINPNNEAGVYMADNPIAVKDDLYNIYAQQVGYRDEGHSDDVSVIYYDKDEKMRIGGYISDSYPKNENGGYDPFRIGNKDFSSDVEVYDAHFRMPESFKSSELKPFEKGLASKFWVSKPIEQKDMDKLLSKPMMYIKDSGKQVIELPMKHLKSSKVGLVTTWRSANNHIHEHEYHLELDKNGGLILARGAGN